MSAPEQSTLPDTIELICLADAAIATAVIEAAVDAATHEWEQGEGKPSDQGKRVRSTESSSARPIKKRRTAAATAAAAAAASTEPDEQDAAQIAAHAAQVVARAKFITSRVEAALAVPGAVSYESLPVSREILGMFRTIVNARRVFGSETRASERIFPPSADAVQQYDAVTVRRIVNFCKEHVGRRKARSPDDAHADDFRVFYRLGLPLRFTPEGEEVDEANHDPLTHVDEMYMMPVPDWAVKICETVDGAGGEPSYAALCDLWMAAAQLDIRALWEACAETLARNVVRYGQNRDGPDEARLRAWLGSPVDDFEPERRQFVIKATTWSVAANEAARVSGPRAAA